MSYAACPVKTGCGSLPRYRRATPPSGTRPQKLRDECLRQEIFYSLKVAQIVIDLWQNTYNHIRRHSSLSYRPPAPVSSPDRSTPGLAFQLPSTATVQKAKKPFKELGLR